MAYYQVYDRRSFIVPKQPWEGDMLRVLFTAATTAIIPTPTLADLYNKENPGELRRNFIVPVNREVGEHALSFQRPPVPEYMDGCVPIVMEKGQFVCYASIHFMFAVHTGINAGSCFNIKPIPAQACPVKMFEVNDHDFILVRFEYNTPILSGPTKGFRKGSVVFGTIRKPKPRSTPEKDS